MSQEHSMTDATVAVNLAHILSSFSGDYSNNNNNNNSSIEMTYAHVINNNNNNNSSEQLSGGNSSEYIKDYSCHYNVTMSHLIFVHSSLVFVVVGLVGNTLSLLVFSSRAMLPVMTRIGYN